MPKLTAVASGIEINHIINCRKPDGEFYITHIKSINLVSIATSTKIKEKCLIIHGVYFRCFIVDISLLNSIIDNAKIKKRRSEVGNDNRVEFTAWILTRLWVCFEWKPEFEWLIRLADIGESTLLTIFDQFLAANYFKI